MRTIKFRDIHNVPYELRIHSETTETDGILIANSVSLESDEVELIDKPVSSSHLSFEVVATTNGQYRDLYTTDARGIKVELFKDNVIEFTGYLDSELYEEDFNFERNYSIVFKCGNVKILKRLPFDLNGRYTVEEIITHILSKIDMKLNYNSSIFGGVDVNNISIKSKDFYVNTSVFLETDIQEEPTNCYDVLEEIMKSLHLISQLKGDTLYVYDLKSIEDKTPVDQYKYAMNDTLLIASECYKKVKLTFETGEKKEMYDLDIDKFEIPYPFKESRLIYDKQYNADYNVERHEGFYQNVSRETKYANYQLIKGSEVCRNSPRFSGSDEIYIRSHTISRNEGANFDKLFETRKMPISFTESPEWFLKIKMDALLSIRSNPYKGVAKKDSDGETSWYENHENDMANKTNYALFYADVFLYDNNGNITHFLSNTNDNDVSAKPAEWYEGWQRKKFIFCYYDNMKNTHPFANGWACNSPTVAAKGTDKKYKYGVLCESMKGQGTLAKLPPHEGNICIRLYKGVDCIDGIDGGIIMQQYSDFKHLWFKDLKISICDANGIDNYSESEYLYQAELDNNAAEILEYDTKLGCVRDGDKSCMGGFTDSLGSFLTAYTYLNKNEHDFLEPEILKAINDYYKTRKFKFTGRYKEINTLDNIYIKDIDGSGIFHPTSYKIDIANSEYELSLKQIK